MFKSDSYLTLFVTSPNEQDVYLNHGGKEFHEELEKTIVKLGIFIGTTSPNYLLLRTEYMGSLFKFMMPKEPSTVIAKVKNKYGKIESRDVKKIYFIPYKTIGGGAIRIIIFKTCKVIESILMDNFRTLSREEQDNIQIKKTIRFLKRTYDKLSFIYDLHYVEDFFNRFLVTISYCFSKENVIWIKAKSLPGLKLFICYEKNGDIFAVPYLLSSSPANKGFIYFEEILKMLNKVMEESNSNKDKSSFRIFFRFSRRINTSLYSVDSKDFNIVSTVSSESKDKGSKNQGKNPYFYLFKNKLEIYNSLKSKKMEIVSVIPRYEENGLNSQMNIYLNIFPGFYVNQNDFELFMDNFPLKQENIICVKQRKLVPKTVKFAKNAEIVIYTLLPKFETNRKIHLKVKLNVKNGEKKEEHSVETKLDYIYATPKLKNNTKKRNHYLPQVMKVMAHKEYILDKRCNKNLGVFNPYIEIVGIFEEKGSTLGGSYVEIYFTLYFYISPSEDKKEICEYIFPTDKDVVIKLGGVNTTILVIKKNIDFDKIKLKDSDVENFEKLSKSTFVAIVHIPTHEKGKVDIEIRNTNFYGKLEECFEYIQESKVTKSINLDNIKYFNDLIHSKVGPTEEELHCTGFDNMDKDQFNFDQYVDMNDSLFLKVILKKMFEVGKLGRKMDFSKVEGNKLRRIVGNYRNDKNVLGFNLLTYSAALDIIYLIRILIEEGYDINHQDNFGNTALHYAYYYDNIFCRDFLIKKGASKTIKNFELITPEKFTVEDIIEKYSV